MRSRKTSKLHTVNISAGIARGYLVKMVQPDYPATAKIAGVQGVVVLHATIGKDGHIANLQVISGPDMLQQAALDAVKKWEYKPYMLNGEPVSVQTSINVIFGSGIGAGR